MSWERERAQKVFTILRETYGAIRWRNPLPPVDELISTILSQNTNDANRDRAFLSLKAAFPDWGSVLDAPVSRVIDAIRPAGLGPQKGPRITAALRRILAERGAIELDFLRGWKPDEALAWLTSLPGVGPKTASIVMLFSLGLPAFPVDTHVHRVSGRLELRPQAMSAEAAHAHLAQWFDRGQYVSAHLYLIRLGRETCRARKPDCAHCPLQRQCPFFKRTIRTRKTI